MNRINLIKYGFIRSEKDDFSDDGARFTCYRVGRVRVSKTTWNGEVFLAGRIDGNILDYDTYSKLPHYDTMDRLNGVSIANLTEEDIQRFYEDCISYEKEYTEAENNTAFPTLAEIKCRCIEIREIRAKEFNAARNLLNSYGYDLLMKIKPYDLDVIHRAMNSLEKSMSGFDPDTYPQSIQKTSYGINFVKPTCCDLKPSYYFNKIKEIVASYC